MKSTVVFLLLLNLSLNFSNAAKYPHICQIGAGISSATIAHFLTEHRLSPQAKISIFERDDQPGGRIRTAHLKHPQLSHTIPVEAGATIIADENLILNHFASLLNLSHKKPHDVSAGFWDDHQFILRTGQWQIKDMFNVLLRYHISFFRQKQLVRSLLARFKNLYPHFLYPSSTLHDWIPHPTVHSLLNHTSLFPLTQLPFTTYIADFTDRHKHELVAAITRVNYGQDPDQMNALSGAVALAGSGSALWKVHEGNENIVSGLFQRANVEMHLDTTVISVKKKAASYLLRSLHQEWECDAVVLAAPFELANISLPESMQVRAQVNRQFQKTYATFVAGFLNNETFGAHPPEQIFTINGSEENFTSLGIAWQGEGDVASVYKIFSTVELSSDTLNRIFLPGAAILAQFPWLAYPRFNPPENFAPFDLDPGGAFFYTSPLESAGSAMEMSAVSGANVAALLKERLGLKEQDRHSSEDKEEL